MPQKLQLQSTNNLLDEINTLKEEIKKLKSRKRYGLIWEDKPEEVVELCKKKLPVLTEKADTRNWQTLPYEISYARISLKPGENTVTLKTQSNTETKETNFTFNLKQGKTKFFAFQSIETLALSEPVY